MADLFTKETSVLDLSSSSCRGLEKNKYYCLVERDDISFDRALQTHEHLFQKINFKIKEMGFENVEELQWNNCEGKWKSLISAYRRAVDHNNKSGNDRKECASFKELSDVYGYRPTVKPVATSSSSGNGDSLSRNEEEETTKAQNDDSEDSQPRKKKRKPSATPEKEQLVPWLETYRQGRAEREAWHSGNSAKCTMSRCTCLAAFSRF